MVYTVDMFYVTFCRSLIMEFYLSSNRRYSGNTDCCVAVSYTHLDVYKRQVCSKRSNQPRCRPSINVSSDFIFKLLLSLKFSYFISIYTAINSHVFLSF